MAWGVGTTRVFEMFRDVLLTREMVTCHRCSHSPQVAGTGTVREAAVLQFIP